MLVEKRIVEYKEQSKTGKAPVTIEWKGERMIRNHSLRATVKEIVRKSYFTDVVKINIIGNQGTGKTTLALTLSHLIHQVSDEMYKIPFSIKVLTKDDYLNFEETIKNLEPANTVLVFDDVSFLSAIADKNTIENIKQKLTEIRHIQDIDVKIILISITHYTLAMQKYLRQCDFSYYTTIGSSELENMQKLVGIQNTNKLLQLRKIYASATSKGKFLFHLGDKKRVFVYNYQNPFAPALFYNENTLRFVIFPLREWIDKICNICTSTQKSTMKDGMDVNEFASELSYKFGEGVAKSAVRIKLFQNGMNVLPRRTKQAMRFIDLTIKDKLINLQKLAEFYNLEDKKTRLKVNPK